MDDEEYHQRLVDAFKRMFPTATERELELVISLFDEIPEGDFDGADGNS